MLTVLCLLFALWGCTDGKAPIEIPDGSTPVYYLTDWKINDQTDTVLSARYPIVGEDDPVAFCLEQLFLQPPEEEGLLSAFPPGAHVVSYEIDEGLLTLNLSDEFGKLSGTSKTLAAACLTMTLYALPEVGGVRLLVDASPWPSEDNDRLSSANFSLDEPILKKVDKKLTLFFVDPEKATLVPEYRQVILRETEPAERYVLEALLGGARESELKSALPADTQLLRILSESKTCYVDLSASFFETQPPFSHLLAIYAIVKSLTDLPDVSDVQFMCEGEIVSFYGDIDLSKPLP